MTLYIFSLLIFLLEGLKVETWKEINHLVRKNQQQKGVTTLKTFGSKDQTF